ncbi:ras GEF [Pseudovirgaria hyperparasitica]|uniref:Ras GEF n=1 Tax=Pseudovirgaria hyperparasitica TaxID=470096 RepID=A0A6A6WF09_9PEZI|nr:ras GEF [Pseudovirgaria hyperparasitica]KAF2760570.1 ras GEF [Pseudovirgaria hyperparasitica]
MPLKNSSGAGSRASRTSSPELRKDGREKVESPHVRVRKASVPHEKQHTSNDAQHLERHGLGNTRELERGGEPGEDYEISQDPFFQRYNISGDAPDRQHSPALSRNSSSDAEGSLSPTHLKPPRLSSPPRTPATGTETSRMPELNICVLGAPSVGKTTFTMSLLGLRTPPTSAFSARKMAIDEQVYLIQLVELPLEDIPNLSGDDGICWPDTIDDMATPRIDAACVLYDVMNRESLAPIPETLNALNKAALPFALVAWKCDNHPAMRKVDPVDVVDRARTFMGDIHTFEASEKTNEVHKVCLSYILRAIMSTREQPTFLTARRRANSSAVRHGAHGQPWAKKHERASSEYSGIRMRMHTPEPIETGSSKLASNLYRRHQRTQTAETTHQTFLDLEDSPGYDSADTEGAQHSDHEGSVVSEMPTDETGYTFDQLVTRLLALPMSKNDTKFQAIFLALYRKFATPGQLLDAIIERFQALENDKKPQVLKTISQLRHLTILEQWIRIYPGDFAYISSQRKCKRFISRLMGVRIFSIAAQEMATDMESVSEDDDTHWACCDKARDQQEAVKSFAHPNSVLDEDSGDEDYAHLTGSASMNDARSLASGPRSSTVSIPTSAHSCPQSLLNGVEMAQRQARGLTPLPRMSLTKVQWHTLIGIDEEHIARELTRIDWVMFQAIRPRDLVRNVTLNAEQKKQCRSLENVNRMTEHFNHTAAWVTNYILLRDKPKHRALMLEKFMRLARKVREMNNYNALGAILAGIKGAPVHRLAATRELIPPLVSKDFMKLDILMNPQRSHFAYRLAWDNSSGERIPYLPLHRRDLVSAAEGNSTFIGERKSDATLSVVHPGTAVFTGRGDVREAPPTGVQGKERINWKKFEIMGEVIVSMQRAQGTPYPSTTRNDEVRSLFLEVKLTKSDDELYERSVALEATASANQQRFNWFKR